MKEARAKFGEDKLLKFIKEYVNSSQGNKSGGVQVHLIALHTSLSFDQYHSNK
jgi:hypothetical protein